MAISWSGIRNAVIVWTRETDWDLVTVVAGFVLALLFPLVGALTPAPFAAYESALKDAAVKTPADIVPLAGIDPANAELLVTTFRRPSLQTGKQVLANDTWVSLPPQLKAACAGAADAVRALQQILGLPETSGERVVYEITVPTADVFRPCVSGPDLQVTACSFDLPPASDPPPAVPAATASAEEIHQAYTALLKAYDTLHSYYDHLRFVSGQMWESYRTGFPRAGAAPGEYPYTGYPFTGMGWSYNWDPSSANHVGVSEFVVRKGAQVTVERALKPDEFCGAGG